MSVMTEAPHFLKLGGSLITAKYQPLTPRPRVIERLAHEIAAARAGHPQRPLLLSHGSGSYGHALGRRYRTRQGVSGAESWRGFAETAHIAAQLHRLVMAALLRAGVPAFSLPPSALVHCRLGEIVAFTAEPLLAALAAGLVPVVYGDVAFDAARGGGIVSTEQVLAALTPLLQPQHISLVGVVDGVFDADPIQHPAARRLPHLTTAQLPDLAAALGGSHGIDVTGGMFAKVTAMADLLAAHPHLRIHLLSGEIPGQVQRHLADPDLALGTTLTR